MATSVYLGGSGGGTPATPTNSIQFNNAGAFGGSSNLEWNNSTNTLAVPNVSAVGGGDLSLESQEADVDASGSTPVLAGAGAGNVSNGTHRYKFSFSDQDTPGGHQTADSGAPTPAVTVTNNAVNGKVNVPIPSNFDNIYAYVNLYRDKNSDGVYKFVGSNEFSGNTTFTDNVADGSLGATMPTTNTTLEPRLIVTGDHLSPFNSTAQGLQINWGDGINRMFWYEVESPSGAAPDWTLKASNGAAGFNGGALNLSGGHGVQADGTLTAFAYLIMNGGSQIAGGNTEWSAGNATGNSAQGASMNLDGGTGTGGGGLVFITGGTGATPNGDGGAISIVAGDANGSGLGGSVLITAGGTGSGTPGDITLTCTDFIKMTGPTLFPGNGSIATGQTNGNSLILRAYDVDGATYKTFLTLTSANTPDMTIGPAAGATVTLQASTYLSADGSTGATTTVTTGSLVGKTMTFKNGLLTSFA